MNPPDHDRNKWHDASRHLDEMPLWLPRDQSLGGHVGADMEDFLVEEIPAYQPNGKGDHLFCWVEKRGMSTPQAIGALARALRVRRSDIGYAGLKDSWAVTRQYLSLFGVAPNQVRHLHLDGIEILEATRHHNKLKIGHLKGNRFTIRVYPTARDALKRSRKLMGILSKKGLPNLYGPQRFGSKDRNVATGMRLLKGEITISDRRKARFLLSSVQSLLFNEYLRVRMQKNTLDRILPGDVLRFGHRFKTAQSGQWTRDEPDAVTGPIYGPRMVQPTQGSEPWKLERAVISDAGLEDQHFRDQGRMTRGGRRDLLIFPQDTSVRSDSKDGILLSFVLPPGSYATVLLREMLAVPYSELRPFRKLEK